MNKLTVYPYHDALDGKKSSGMAADGYAKSKLSWWPELEGSKHSFHATERTYGLVLSSVPEHQPSVESGQRSVTFTTIDLVTSGKKGGVPVYELSRVKLKHLPQAGPCKENQRIVIGGG